MISIQHSILHTDIDNSLIMSKRLNKRQQREQEELEQLRAQESAVPAAPESDATGGEEVKETSDVEEQEATGPAPVNPFAAVRPTYQTERNSVLTEELQLGGEDDQDDEDESEEEAPDVNTTKKVSRFIEGFKLMYVEQKEEDEEEEEGSSSWCSRR